MLQFLVVMPLDEIHECDIVHKLFAASRSNVLDICVLMSWLQYVHIFAKMSNGLKCGVHQAKRFCWLSMSLVSVAFRQTATSFVKR
jgi:hypothetical protein